MVFQESSEESKGVMSRSNEPEKERRATEDLAKFELFFSQDFAKPYSLQKNYCMEEGAASGNLLQERDC
eukprot:1066735-Pelagomonas_calceolata.AAC.4